MPYDKDRDPAHMDDGDHLSDTPDNDIVNFLVEHDPDVIWDAVIPNMKPEDIIEFLEKHTDKERNEYAQMYHDNR